MQITSKDIFDAINQIRQNPGLALNQIKDQFKRFQSNGVYRNKRDIRIRTISGKSNWQDAILSLERQKCKGNFSWNTILAKAAEQYAQVAKQDPSINPFDVIKNFCSYQGNISFNVNQSDAQQQIIQLIATMIVGDGDQKKGVRTAIFHPLYKQFACSVNKSGNKNILYTIFAQSVKQKTNNTEKPKPQVIYKAEQQSSQSRSQVSWNMPPPSEARMFENQGIADKYRSKQENMTYEDYIKKGKQLIAELNKIRKQPKNYVHALKAQIQKFKDDKTLNADYGTVLTKEGNIPYFDLISQLEAQYPLPTIRQVTGLSVIALQQIKQQQNSLMEYKTPIQQLIDRFCNSVEGIRSIKLREIGEMPVQAMLMRLLVGDGDRKRTGRRKMLSPICKAVGCSISKNMLVINVGQTAKNNPGVIEQYLENINQQKNYSGINISPKKTQSKFSQDKSSSSQGMFSFQNKSQQSPINFSGQKVVIKKTSKTHNESKAGRIYRITQIQIIYNDGQIQKLVEEELLQ